MQNASWVGPVRTRGQRAEFRRVAGRDAAAGDLVVHGLRAGMHCFYDAAAGRMLECERYTDWLACRRE